MGVVNSKPPPEGDEVSNPIYLLDLDRHIRRRDEIFIRITYPLKQTCKRKESENNRKAMNAPRLPSFSACQP